MHFSLLIFIGQVASLWILDALHVALRTHALYYYLINLFGNFAAIYDVVCVKSFSTCVFCIPFVYGNVHNPAICSILYNNVYLLIVDRNSYKVVLWFVILAVTAAFKLFLEYRLQNIYSLSSFLSMERIRKSVWVAFSAAAVSDFTIAFSMCYYLHKSRLVTNFSRFSYQCMLVVITHYGTNILPQFFIWPNSFVFIGIDFILPKYNGEQGDNILLTETQTSDHVKHSHNCEV
ncbi:hypothetical protein ARMGADRAFT_1040610 [Armillaria gallica]|uniref:DUF6534 domain-containing protein n=1 Tax=Armillaria gallica TaxID=47427 RepID=A0A2H3CKI0_ARMGA|nr:hypothetical protein ARMGADRAFT_1040610 [Armillaria gallica]